MPKPGWCLSTEELLFGRSVPGALDLSDCDKPFSPPAGWTIGVCRVRALISHELGFPNLDSRRNGIVNARDYHEKDL